MGPGDTGEVDPTSGATPPALEMSADDRTRLRRVLTQLSESLGRHLATAARIARRAAAVGAAAAAALLLVIVVGWPPAEPLHWVVFALTALVVAQPAFTLWRASLLLGDLSSSPWSVVDVPSVTERAVDRVMTVANDARSERLGLRGTIQLVRELRSVQEGLESEIPGLSQLLQLADPAFNTRLGLALLGVPVLVAAIPVAALAAIVS